MNHLMTALAFVASAAALPASSATVLELDFGDTVQSAFGTAGNLTMSYANVAAGINATLTAEAPFAVTNATNNGSVLGDARVNATIGATADLSLKLWDSSKGNRYTVAYNPGNAFDWTLGFFDIDGSPNTFDVVILRSPGS